MSKREKIGKLAYDLMKEPVKKYNALQLAKESEESYLKELRQCAEINSDLFPGDFFIQVLLQKEQLLHNVLRNKFIALKDCPRPEYDQTLYKFHKDKQQIEFIWVIPDLESCLMLMRYKNEVVQNERPLLQFVMDFYNGTLYKKMKALNNEKPLTPELKK